MKNLSSMDNYIKLYSDFLNEGDKKGESFEEFSKTRLAGAAKITEAAKEKGGDALLTYHHFRVKLPVYEKAAAGKFDEAEAREEMEALVKALVKGTAGSIKLEQVEFQKLVGLIEVFGELLIRKGA
jgi:hypothetical protein